MEKEKETEEDLKLELKDLNEELSSMMSNEENEAYWSSLHYLKELDKNADDVFYVEHPGSEQFKQDYEELRYNLKDLGVEIEPSDTKFEGLGTDWSYLYGYDEDSLSEYEKEELYEKERGKTISFVSDVIDEIKTSLDKATERFKIYDDYKNLSYYSNLLGKMEDRKEEIEENLKSFSKEKEEKEQGHERA